MAFAGKWMKLENIMLSEISQSQKAKGRMISLISGGRHIMGGREGLVLGLELGLGRGASMEEGSTV